MKDFIKEVVLEHLHNEWGFDVNELATELYNHEFNGPNPYSFPFLSYAWIYVFFGEETARRARGTKSSDILW